jgi:hypothetical protein
MLYFAYQQYPAAGATVSSAESIRKLIVVSLSLAAAINLC